MYRIFLLAGFLISVFTAAPAFADGPEANQIQYFTREQYRACLDSEERLNDLRKVLDQRAAESDGMMLQIQTEAKALFDAQKNLRPFDEAGIRAFNTRIGEHNKKIAAANENAGKLQAEHEAFYAESLEHNRSCGGLLVKMADREAVMAEREAAIAERKAAMAEPKAAMAEPKAAMAEPKAAMAEPKAAMAERDAVLAEPKAAMAEREAVLAEPKAAGKP